MDNFNIIFGACGVVSWAATWQTAYEIAGTIGAFICAASLVVGWIVKIISAFRKWKKHKTTDTEFLGEIKQITEEIKHDTDSHK